MARSRQVDGNTARCQLRLLGQGFDFRFTTINSSISYTVLAFLPALYERWLFIVIAAVGAVLLGIGLEYAQLFLGRRHFEIGDMIADTGGVALDYWLASR